MLVSADQCCGIRAEIPRQGNPAPAAIERGKVDRTDTVEAMIAGGTEQWSGRSAAWHRILPFEMTVFGAQPAQVEKERRRVEEAIHGQSPQLET